MVCNNCSNDVIPYMKFEPILFFLMLGIFYIPYSLKYSNYCPVCDSQIKID